MVRRAVMSCLWLLTIRVLHCGATRAGAANAVLASSKATPCFRKFADAFRGSQLKRSPISAIYRAISARA